MHPVVIEKPYEFVPPYRGKLWSGLAQWYLPRYLERTAGITQVQCEHVERLTQSIEQGHGVLLTPNHLRPQDPMVMGLLARDAKTHFFTMASWHLFMQSSLQRWAIRRMGAFSVYREGMDRTSVNTAVDMLASGERPLVVFPEGVLTRTNDRLGNFMEGVAFMARTAAEAPREGTGERRRQDGRPPRRAAVHVRG